MTTVQYNTAQYSTAQYITVQHSTVHYITLHYSTVQYSTLQYKAPGSDRTCSISGGASHARTTPAEHVQITPLTPVCKNHDYHENGNENENDNEN